MQNLRTRGDARRSGSEIEAHCAAAASVQAPSVLQKRLLKSTAERPQQERPSDPAELQSNRGLRFYVNWGSRCTNRRKLLTPIDQANEATPP